MTNLEDRVAPRTAAGRAMLYELQQASPHPWLTPIQTRAAILAIEAEAASLDSDELRKAVEAFLMPLPDHRTEHEHPSWPSSECDECLAARKERYAALRAALLSAGDKAEAPLDPLFEVTISAYEQSGLPGDWGRAQQMKRERALGIPVSDYSTDPLRERNARND